MFNDVKRQVRKRTVIICVLMFIMALLSIVFGIAANSVFDVERIGAILSAIMASVFVLVAVVYFLSFLVRYRKMMAFLMVLMHNQRVVGRFNIYPVEVSQVFQDLVKSVVLIPHKMETQVACLVVSDFYRHAIVGGDFSQYLVQWHVIKHDGLHCCSSDSVVQGRLARRRRNTSSLDISCRFAFGFFVMGMMHDIDSRPGNARHQNDARE